MPETNQASEILRVFIADEESGARTFWAMNWNRITPLAGKATDLLPSEEAERFYLCFLRCEGKAPAVPPSALPSLLAAYRNLLPEREKGGYRHHWHVFTFLFGFVEQKTTPGELRDAKTLTERLKLINHLQKFSHLPGMRGKPDGFKAAGMHAPHILDVLRLLGYRSDYGQGENDSYDVVNLTYWGLVFVVLWSKSHRTALLTEMLDEQLDLPKREQIESILHEFVQAVLPACDTDEKAFHALATQLAAKQRARVNLTESVALAQSLDLPFEEGEDWIVSIAAPATGHTAWYKPPNLKLEFRADADYDWSLQLNAGQFRLSERDGYLSDNVGGLPSLGRLADFPAWLHGIEKSHGLRFDLAKGRIFCGKKRSAAKLITRWIESGLS
ncbi:hypothetical protein J8I29_01620 [Labrys sp. LIt4]|uniref:hypothetical protein n=1 Tax=Labrys sp. LIt4 TaxID=2821355 RepID=UPI001ADF475F|nr:hypothetical protein [Labrys sp. LIt4]MBP0577995.1 hypothetical protein [Labrys sp. LIt4]